MAFKTLEFLGGWYADAKADGKYGVTRAGNSLWTSAGVFPKPPDGDPLFLVVSQPGTPFKLAGKAHDAFATWEYVNDVWVQRENGYGNFSQMYDWLGNLHISNDVAIGVNGWRYCTPENVLVTGDATYGVVHGVNEWTDLSDAQDRSFIVGQGNQGGGVQIHFEGQQYWLHKGADYAVRANRVGSMCAFAFYNVMPNGLTAFVLFGTLDDIRGLERVETAPIPPQPIPPDPTPVPPKPEPPTPMPQPPSPETFPPLKATQRYWLHPNIDSDVPAACHADLATVDVFGLYDQWLKDETRYAQLDTLKDIRRQGVNLSIEGGVLKPGDYHGESAQAGLPIISQRVLAKGHRVGYFVMDEPLTGTYQAYENGTLVWLDTPVQSLEESVFAIAKFVEKAREAMPGVKVIWAEAYPQISLETMRRCLLMLDSWGCHLDGWHLDIDWKRAEREGLNPYDMIRLAKPYADDYKAPLGVYLVGYPHATDVDYYHEVVRMADDLHAEASWCIDHVLIQSWAARTGTGQQDLPANFGDHGLFPLFGEVQEQIFT